jgi:S1-C subfamily serine protease
LNDPVFREFFGNQLPQQPNQENENSLGSGVIVRPDGYILTNNHVIAQADQIVVGLNDGRRAVAKVIGTDPDTDLAVIKIDLDKLPVYRLNSVVMKSVMWFSPLVIHLESDKQ